MKNNKNLIELTSHIIEKYHNPLREDIEETKNLLDKIIEVHWNEHSEFQKIKNVFILFSNKILNHLNKEEKILFPMMIEIENNLNNNKILWDFHCWSIQNPIKQMEVEHWMFDWFLWKIKELSNNFFIPDNACKAYTRTYELLKKIYNDTLEHANFENTVLHKIRLEKENINKI